MSYSRSLPSTSLSLVSFARIGGTYEYPFRWKSFGFAEKFINEACHINEVVFWNPSSSAGEGIVRTKRTPDVRNLFFFFC
jgi:hypothetical protein